MKLFSIRDSKAQAYLPPRAYRTRSEAIRALQMEMDNKESMINKFPLDYSFHELAEWDELKGNILPYSPSELIGICADLAIKQ